MNWNLRRSIKFPGGVRINFSRRGIGYSWGVRGFRFGRDASGRAYHAVSVPGTGVYARTAVSGERRRFGFWHAFTLGLALGLLRGVGRERPGCGCLILALLLGAPIILIAGAAEAFRAIPAPVALALAATGLVLLLHRHWRFEVVRDGRNTPAAPVHAPTVLADSAPRLRDPAEQIPAPDKTCCEAPVAIADVVDGLAVIEASLKEALRPLRMATWARDLVRAVVRNTITRFGVDDQGRLTPDAAALYAAFLHRWHRTPRDVALQVLARTPQQPTGENEPAATGAWVVAQLENWDATTRTKSASLFADMIAVVAAYSAAVDGSIRPEKAAAVEALAGSLRAGLREGRASSGAAIAPPRQPPAD